MGCIRGITENSRGGIRMKVLLTGAAGQLGYALRQQVPAGVELIATSRSGDPATDLLPLDLADAAVCRAAVLEHRPDWVLNAGAYTALCGGPGRHGLPVAAGEHRLCVQRSAGQPLPPRVPSAWLQPPGAKPCASCWRPWCDLNRGQAQPAQGC